tara:strand:- start:152 stop:793 length:642 start_codon:yes stop_codon:yes gene_type:complete
MKNPTDTSIQITSDTSKLDFFSEYFSIDYNFTVNVSSLIGELPSYDEFMQQMPLPFKIASDIVSLDQSALQPLQALSGVANQLVDYLQYQNKKVDLLIGYIISQENNPAQSAQGIKIGGGGIVFTSNKSYQLGEKLPLKIFLKDDSLGVYCLSEIVEISETNTADNTVFSYKVIFHYIREDDREILVRCSLHEQSKQLQALAQKRSIDKGINK